MSAASQQDQETSSLRLDDQWERQQKKTFTAWANSHLRKRDLKVEDVEKDFCDGKILLQLLEILSSEALPKPAKGNMRIHKVQNVGAAFSFIKEKGVKLVSIGPEEIVDGNLKMTLGMLWTLILRYEIQDISLDQLSAKDALLLWCQRKTEPYSNVDVQNFHLSFKDGLAFCALIHRHRPELIDYNALSKTNPRQNLQYAFETAEKYLDIPQMLDLEDMMECVKPDERSVMTYVAAYYKCFASSNKTESAAKKVAAVLETNREHERLMQEYETMASNLLAWIAANVARLNERVPCKDVAACQEKLEANNTFRSSEYPAKLTEKGDLEAHYSTLQTKLRLSGRPAFVPSEGKLVSDVAAAWVGLEAAQSDHLKWIVDELRRCQLAENKAERFRMKADTHEAWTSGKDTLLTTDNYSSANLAAVVALKKKHEAFQSDLTAHESRVHEIGTLANELDELKYHAADEVNDRYAAIYEQWQRLVQLTHDRQAAIDAAEERQKQLDELYLEYARQAPAFSNIVDLAQEKLTENYLVDTEADVAELQGVHEQFKSELPSYEASYAALKGLIDQQAAAGGAENPYSPHNFVDLEAKWQRVLALVTERDQRLAAEAQKQADREGLRTSWAEHATAADAWLTAKNNEAKTVAQSASFESLETQIAALQTAESELASFQPTLDGLEGLHQQISDNLIFTNPHTHITIEHVRGLWHQSSGGIKRFLTELGNQVLTRDSTNITEEQMKEYRESFKHFDKDGSNKLERKEFRACLISLGYPIPQIPSADDPDTEFNRVMARVDPNGDNVVSFDEFIQFMVEENADAETSSQLLDAFRVLAAGKPYVLASELQRDLPADLYQYCLDNVVSFDEFIQFMVEENADAETSSQLLDAFRVLAAGKPYVLASELQRDLPADLYQYCLDHMSPYEGGPEGALDFATFSSALYGESDL